MTLLNILRFLHILAAAAWLGAAIWAPGDIRRTLALGKPYTDALPARTRPALSLDLWTGVATLVTGLALLGAQGGVPRAGIMVGFAAVLVRLALLTVGMRPAWKRVEASVAAGDLAAAQAPARRVAMLDGMGHLLWVIALAGMVFPF